MGGKPIQIQAVRVELAGSGGHQRLGLARFDAIEEGVDACQPVRREPVLVMAEVQNRYVVSDFEVCAPSYLLNRRTGSLPRRPLGGGGCRWWVAWACAAEGGWGVRQRS